MKIPVTKFVEVNKDSDTNEVLEKLIKLLKNLGVKVLRKPTVDD